MNTIGLLSATTAMLFWSIASTFSKKIIKKIGIYNSSIVYLLGSFLAALIGVLIFGTKTVGPLPILLLIGAGIFYALGYILQFKSVRTEQVTNSYAISEIQTAILILFGIFVLKENVNIIQIASIVVIFIGVMLVSTKQKHLLNKKLRPAFFGNISYAIFWLFTILAINTSGSFVLPLLFATLVAMLITIPFGIFGKRINLNAHFEREILTFALTIGLIDGLGDVLFSFASYVKLVSIGSAIAALVPFVIGILCYFVYHERLSKMQLIGLIIAVVGAVALGL